MLSFKTHLSEAKRRAVQAQARSKGLGAALGVLGGLVQAAQERARRTEQAAEQRAARKEELLDKQMKSLTAKPQEWKAAAQAYLTQKALDAFRAQERSSASLPAAGEGKSLWQKTNEWVQDKVEKFVYHPPSWLSVSYSSAEFSLGNYTAAHWISYQPSAENFLEEVTYQKKEIRLTTKGTLTTNPKGVVDIDLSDGTVTFNVGDNSSFFIQPGALSFGWKSSNPPPKQIAIVASNVQTVTVNQTVVDFDLFGKNMLSLKVSHGIGNEDSQVFDVNGTEVKRIVETKLDVAVSVHRWPRVIAAATALYFVWDGVVAVAPLAWEKAVAIGAAIWTWLQNIPVWQIVPGGQ